MVKKSKSRRMHRAYQQLTNDQLAQTYMEQLEEYKRIERTLMVMRSVAQERMEDLGLRQLPTDGPIRIKGALLADLSGPVREAGNGKDKTLAIKRVSFAPKEVVRVQNPEPGLEAYE